MSDFIKIVDAFSDDKSIPGNVTRVLLKKAFETILLKRLPSNTIVEFDFEKEEFLIINAEKVETRAYMDCGRRFILASKQEFIALLNLVYPKKFPLKSKPKIEETETVYREYDDDGPYCSACMQSPCMCSDREESSTIYDY